MYGDPPRTSAPDSHSSRMRSIAPGSAERIFERSSSISPSICPHTSLTCPIAGPSNRPAIRTTVRCPSVFVSILMSILRLKARGIPQFPPREATPLFRCNERFYINPRGSSRRCRHRHGRNSDQHRMLFRPHWLTFRPSSAIFRL
jgi:hypothetical protein